MSTINTHQRKLKYTSKVNNSFRFVHFHWWNPVKFFEMGAHDSLRLLKFSFKDPYCNPVHSARIREARYCKLNFPNYKYFQVRQLHFIQKT